jgi:hypothetical protein
MENNTKKLNLVYDNWDDVNNKPIPNGSWDASNLIRHFVEDSVEYKKFELKKCRLKDVYENKDEKHYYFYTHGRDELSQIFTLKLDEKTKLPFDIDILNCLKDCPNFYFVYITEHEPDNETGFRILQEFIIYNKLNESQFYVINNNAKLDEYKIKYNSEINVHSIQFIPHSSTKVLDYVGGCNFVPKKTGKFAMLFNKSSRPQRASLLCLLMKNGLLNQMNWSSVPPYKTKIDKWFFKDLLNDDDINNIESEIDKFSKLEIKVSDFEEEKNWFTKHNEPNMGELPKIMTIPEYPKNYENSYINIVTESEFFKRHNVIHITEKSFRPFYYYQIPLIMATVGHIKKMRERYDLDFFDDIIDHTYDSIKNDRDRLYAFVKEIERIFQNKDQIIEFYVNNKERFENNKRKIIKNLDLVNNDYKFFKNLI